MNLEFFNNLIKSDKKNTSIQNFVKELGEYLEKNKQTNENLKQLQEKLTIGNRDKFFLKRLEILNQFVIDYAKNDVVYYIYDKSQNIYNACICEDGQSHNVIQIEEKSLPEGTQIGTCLTLQDGKYVVDQRATRLLKSRMKDLILELLKEQNNEIQKNRIEGHKYKVIQNDGKRVWLEDVETKKIFEENQFKAIDEAEIGMIYRFENEKYKLVLNYNN